MKILELYSGIGGMHLALKESGVNGKIVTSMDINPLANAVYKHNFPDTPALNRNIENLTSATINELDVDTILMSPPCQPFTRNGLRADVDDPRCKSFLHLLTILPNTNVKRIVIENVKGFEGTEMNRRLQVMLHESGFTFREFILTPIQFKVPNSRPRYYCIAKKFPESFFFDSGSLLHEIPSNLEEIDSEVNKLSRYLEKDFSIDDYLVPEEILAKRIMALDVCHSDSEKTCCFTKSYGRYVTGTGSIFSAKSKEEVDKVREELNNHEDYLKSIAKLQLRFFTPREVCRLMSFPDWFQFPDDVTNRQKYMLLGNSINVTVVAALIKLLAD